MELVPIIQISLALFTGLLILVLIISYIVFKMNKNEQAKQFKPEYSLQMNQGYYPETMQDQSYPQTSGMYDEYSAYYNAYDAQQVQAQPIARHESFARQSRYTVVYNDGNSEKAAYYPERSTGYKYRFAPTKNTNAFAQFK
ncbi:MAG TPA: hypothetical protein VHO03_08530 [Ignavibacteriales bacterium]|nr:hypothetical protein [Ignavibacteriales bacterium]